MTDWVRLWHDMPTDPKWRVVARRSGQPITAVLAVFVFMMTNASANAEERGVLASWDDEDVAAALDMEPEGVRAIIDAMQGKVVDGERLSGWEKRQPKREDGASERAKNWRERKRTQANAEERPEADTDTDTVPTGTAAVAAEPDYRDLVWTEGAQAVARLTGKPIDKAKSFIGKCLKETKDDCRQVLNKIRQAEADRVVDPAAWISAAVRSQAPPGQSPHADFQAALQRHMHGTA